MKYLIAIMVPGKEGEFFAGIQKKFWNGRWNISLPPHITLIPPFSVEDESKLIESISDTVRNIKEFRIDLNGVGYFNNNRHPIYVAVKNNPGLWNLQESFSSTVDNDLIEEKYQKFIPHITLSNNLTNEEFKDRYPVIQKIQIPTGFVCKSIMILRKEDDTKIYQELIKLSLGR